MAKRPARAERVFKAVLNKDPTSVSAETGMAVTAMMRRDFLSAEAALKRAISYDPGRVTVYETLAQVYDATAREWEAEQMRQIARRLGADSTR
jgi:Tfp pilus assembly protein PilF